ncbi:hypothetical protein LY78DRAFT_319358 [Colletotrichum sublineola]|nr:hypothetical protein LY78DRAFT_319358 [Colletotrichum sublineola]
MEPTIGEAGRALPQIRRPATYKPQPPMPSSLRYYRDPEMPSTLAAIQSHKTNDRSLLQGRCPLQTVRESSVLVTFVVSELLTDVAAISSRPFRGIGDHRLARTGHAPNWSPALPCPATPTGRILTGVPGQ